MKKHLFFGFSFVALLAVSCKKEKDQNPNPNPNPNPTTGRTLYKTTMADTSGAEKTFEVFTMDSVYKRVKLMDDSMGSNGGWDNSFTYNTDSTVATNIETYNGTSRTRTYNYNNSVLASSTQGNMTTTYAMNADGRIASSEYPYQGNTYKQVYTWVNGNCTKIENYTNNTLNTEQTFTYDSKINPFYKVLPFPEPFMIVIDTRYWTTKNNWLTSQSKNISSGQIYTDTNTMTYTADDYLETFIDRGRVTKIHYK